MSRLPPGRMLLYVALFILGFVAVSAWSFWLTVRPPRITIPGKPADYGLSAEEVTIETADGLELAGWLIPRQDQEVARRGGTITFSPSSLPSDRMGMREEEGVAGMGPAVILLHGYPAEKADMLPIARALHPRVTALLLDLRYFGKSQGRFTTLGLRERDDLKKVVDFLEARGFAKIGVFGFSLGGAIGILTAAEDPRLGAVAAYAPFADLGTLGREAYAQVWILKYPLVELMRLWARVFFGADVTRPTPADAAGKLSIPVLVVASREDDEIPFRHAERLAEALGENPRAEFYFQERGRHGELPPDFDARIIDFFKRSLK